MLLIQIESAFLKRKKECCLVDCNLFNSKKGIILLTKSSFLLTVKTPLPSLSVCTLPHPKNLTRLFQKFISEFS